MVATPVHMNILLHIERGSLLEDNEMEDRARQGVLAYPPPVTVLVVTRWELSRLEMTQPGMRGNPLRPRFTEYVQGPK